MSLASCASGQYDAYLTGLDGAIWRKSFDGSTFGAWTRVGGLWTSGPGAVCKAGTTTTDVFERGPEGGLWQVEIG